MDKDINIKVRVWRQHGPKEKGRFETYSLDKVSQSASILVGNTRVEVKLLKCIRSLWYMNLQNALPETIKSKPKRKLRENGYYG